MLVETMTFQTAAVPFILLHCLPGVVPCMCVVCTLGNPIGKCRGCRSRLAAPLSRSNGGHLAAALRSWLEALHLLVLRERRIERQADQLRDGTGAGLRELLATPLQQPDHRVDVFLRGPKPQEWGSSSRAGTSAGVQDKSVTGPGTWPGRKASTSPSTGCERWICRMVMRVASRKSASGSGVYHTCARRRRRRWKTRLGELSSGSVYTAVYGGRGGGASTPPGRRQAQAFLIGCAP